LASKHHIPALDGLRGIAVLLVLWTHIPTGVFPGGVDYARGLVFPGYLGVDIFFVLSGFLITRILLVDREKDFPLRYFLLRRFFRIFPIYYMTLALMVCFWAVPGIGWCAVYLSNFYFPFNTDPSPLQHTWSLAVEEHFYLLWPLLVYRLSPARSRGVALFVMIPFALVCAVLVILSPYLEATKEWILQMRKNGTIDSDTWVVQLIYMGSMCRFSSLALGSLFAFMEGWIHRKARMAFFIAVIAFLLGEGAIQYTLHIGVRESPAIQLFWPLIRLAAFTVISGSIVLAGVTSGSIRRLPSFLLDNAVLRWIGRVSYGLYLYHFPIFHLWGFYSTPKGELSAWSVSLGVAVAIGVASVSYLLIERPILNYAGRFRKK
jgi:peptidoglycan/LPS O-acetylase OafA/YrhL